MKIETKLITWFCLLILSLTLIPVTVSSQSAWLDPTVESSLSLEILKPDFSSSYYWYNGDLSGAKAYSSVWFLTLKTRLSDNAFLLFELPSSHFDADRTYSPCYSCERIEFKGQSLIGNPFLGVEATSSVSPFYGQFGLRLPVASDDKRLALEQGVVADPNRLGAFLHDVLTVRTRMGFRTREKSGLAYHVFLGACWLNPVGDLSEADSEIYLDYGSQLWFVTDKARLGAGLVGLLLVTGEGVDLGESSLHQFGVAANFLSGRFRPGGHLRVPLDDDMPGLQYVWVLTLQIGLGSD